MSNDHNEHNEQNRTMEVTSAITGDKIRIDPRKVNTMAISHHKHDLGFVRMDDGKAWIVKESLAELASIYSDAMEEA